MKLWQEGCRIFKGLNNFKVYHFGSLTARKNENVKQNRGDNTFLLKWGISISFFKKYYLKSKTIYNGPLNHPKKNFFYFIDLLKCKIKLIYLKIYSNFFEFYSVIYETCELYLLIFIQRITLKSQLL